MDINAERNNAIFRKNSKVHIFAGLLECGERHNNLYSKQDKPNLDGFIPSLYVCSGRYNHLGCSQKTISDNFIGTFVLNYISNILKISKMLKKDELSLKDLETLLLKGKTFQDIIGLDTNTLVEMYSALMYSPKYILLAKSSVKASNKENDFEIENLRKEKNKFQRALSRLEDLYLFDEEDMSEKDYILKKNKTNEKLQKINNKIKVIASDDISSVHDLDFIVRANNVVLINELLNKESLNHKQLIQKIGRDIIKDFTNTIIDKIIIKNKKIINIKFKNGLTSVFIYNN